MDTTPTEGPHMSEIKDSVETTVHKNASWGAIISIVVILAMIVIGAFYAWGKRVAEEYNYPATSATTTTY